MNNIMFKFAEKWRNRKILGMYDRGVSVPEIARIMNMKIHEIKWIITRGRNV